MAVVPRSLRRIPALSRAVQGLAGMFVGFLAPAEFVQSLVLLQVLVLVQARDLLSSIVLISPSWLSWTSCL